MWLPVVSISISSPLAGRNWSHSIWTALFFPTRLALPPPHSSVNSGIRWESLVKALLFYSPTQLHLAWIFPPIFNAYVCIQRPHGLLPLKAVYGLFVRQLKRSQFLYHRKEHLAFSLVCVPSISQAPAVQFSFPVYDCFTCLISWQINS